MKWAVAAALLLLGCARGSALDGECADDGDCAGGLHCLRGTGVCVGFNTPVDDLGAPPDLAPDDAAHG